LWLHGFSLPTEGDGFGRAGLHAVETGGAFSYIRSEFIFRLNCACRANGRALAAGYAFLAIDPVPDECDL
jgi:hypothetical protein